MASKIWDPLEELAAKMFRFSEISLTAHVHNGRVHKVTVALGATKLSWSLEDAERGKVALRVLE